MKETTPCPPAGNPTATFLLTALITLCGLEMMRVLFSFSLFVLRDRLSWEVINAGLIIFALFLAAFLAALLRRLVRDRWLLLLTVGGLGLLRLLLQLWTGDPVGTLLLAGLGVFCFWLSWPFLLATLDLGRPAPRHQPGLVLNANRAPNEQPRENSHRHPHRAKLRLDPQLIRLNLFTCQLLLAHMRLLHLPAHARRPLVATRRPSVRPTQIRRRLPAPDSRLPAASRPG